MGEEELKALSVTNIGAAVSQLPAFRASTNPTTNGFGSFDVPALKDQELEVFAVINHLFDKTPPFAPEGQYPTNPTYFDQIGRTYRLGVRLNF